MSLKLLKLTFVEASIAAVALMLTIASTFIYLTAKPRVDMILLAAPLACSIAILAAEYLSGEIKIDLTPLGSAPTAYTLYYITSEYLRQVREPQTLSYSIILGSTIAIITLTVILIMQRSR